MSRFLLSSVSLLLLTASTVAAGYNSIATWVLVAGQPGEGPGPEPVTMVNGVPLHPQHFKPAVTGSNDGKGQAALFDTPANIALDEAGNVYAVDQHGSTVRRIGVDAAVTTVARLPGRHTDDGDYNGIAVDHGGNIFISVPAEHTVLKITHDGSATVYAGSPKVLGYRNGPATKALFYRPQGLAVDAAGNLYVADTYNNAIRKVSPEGLVTTVAGGGQGLKDGPAREAKFDFPVNLAVDHSGNIYVVESMIVEDEGRSEPSNAIREITAEGKVITLGEDSYGGARDGRATSFKEGDAWLDGMQSNTSIAVDSYGWVYFVSRGGVARFDPAAHHSYVDNADLSITVGPNMQWPTPVGIAVNSRGEVYISDSELAAIFKATLPPSVPSKQ